MNKARTGLSVRRAIPLLAACLMVIFLSGCPIALFFLRAQAPGITPTSGEYNDDQLVTLSTATPEAGIRYTIDGTSPTGESGIPYTAPFLVSNDATVQAVAYREGLLDSSVTTAYLAFNYDSGSVYTPTLTPDGGTFEAGITVRIQSGSGSPACSYRYTLDGSTPTRSIGTLYSAPVTLTESATLKAVGYETGFATSGVATAEFSIYPAMTWTACSSLGTNTWADLALDADGSFLVACSNSGYIYTTTDFGATWYQRNAAGGRYWTSVACSSDGSRLAATASANYVYTSSDSGVSWTSRTAAGSRYWTAIATSADGSRLAACVGGEYIYTSADYGVSWTQRNAAGSRPWDAIESSSDGSRLAAICNGSIYGSEDYGATWTLRTSIGSISGNDIAMSSDGLRIAVSYYNYASDVNIVLSADGGVTWTQSPIEDNANGAVSIDCSSDGANLVFSPLTDGALRTSSDYGTLWRSRTSAGSRNWDHVAISSDGTRMAASIYYGTIYLGR